MAAEINKSIGHGNTQQAGNFLIVEKKLTLGIKFIFGSFPGRKKTFWCFLLTGFFPLLFSDLLSFFSSLPENHLKPVTITKTKHISEQKKKLKPYERESVCEKEMKVTGSWKISRHSASLARARRHSESGLGGVDGEVTLVPLMTAWEP